MTTNAAPDPSSTVRPIRAPRPNYRLIHTKPLPIDTFPLPALIPHNPFSLIHIAYVYLSHLIFPPESHASNIVHGVYSPDTNSVHIKDHASARLLWERGFFGKGSLSRSEPTWLEREKKRVGLLANDTSEEYTQQRREERRVMKLERARKEREAIEAKLVEEGGKALNGDIKEESEDPLTVDVSGEEPVEATPQAEDGDPSKDALEGSLSDADLLLKPVAKALGSQTHQSSSNDITQSSAKIPDHTAEVQDQEHLQLTSEEAFFLAYALGILQIHDPAINTIMTTLDLLTAFRRHSYFPPIAAASQDPRDPFLPSYAVYHHFRSLGWVVRPGIKFAVDWLLYLRGPAFTHAEFAVLVLPAFGDEYWWEESRREETLKRERKDWWWLHCMQRVQAHVRKGLIICWVEIPSPAAVDAVMLPSVEKDGEGSKGIGEGQEGPDIGRLFKMYKVRDMTVKRWLPNRSRD